jgi:hypothetical protein
MLQLTELLRKNELVAHRKFIETFANGIIVYSLYLYPTANHQARITHLLQQFSMLHLVPQSPLTPLFLNGEFSVRPAPALRPAPDSACFCGASILICAVLCGGVVWCGVVWLHRPRRTRTRVPRPNSFTTS